MKDFTAKFKTLQRICEHYFLNINQHMPIKQKWTPQKKKKPEMNYISHWRDISIHSIIKQRQACTLPQQWSSPFDQKKSRSSSTYISHVFQPTQMQGPQTIRIYSTALFFFLGNTAHINDQIIFWINLSWAHKVHPRSHWCSPHIGE